MQRHLEQVIANAISGVFATVLIVASGTAHADAPQRLDQATVDAIVAQAHADANNPAEAPAMTNLAVPPAAPSTPVSFLSGVASKAGDVVVGALNMIGVRYRWGGNTPDSGLDCSGFVRYVFQDTLGMQLPRRAEDMSRVGEKVKISDLQPGDLVFFNTMRRSFSHVGIYIGDNKFVHSPSTGSTIRVDEMDNSYWEKHFTGGRRIDVSYSPGEQDDLKTRLKRFVSRASN